MIMTLLVMPFPSKIQDLTDMNLIIFFENSFISRQGVPECRNRQRGPRRGNKKHVIPIKAANRRPEKSRKWKSLFSVLVLLCVHFMMSD